MYWNTYLNQIHTVLDSIPPTSLYSLVRTLYCAYQNGKTVYTCGNGGSASSASHLAQDLSKGTLVPGRPRLRCISLCDSIPNITAWANDDGYTHVFSEQLQGLGQSGDLLIAISGSGKSTNILRAVRVAHDLEMRTWGVTGFDGGQLIQYAHRSLHVKCNDMGMVEAAHGVVFHWLITCLRATIEEGALVVPKTWGRDMP